MKKKYELIKKKNFSKQRLSGIIFTRAFCSLGIVIFHFFCHSKRKLVFLMATANSSWGFMFVTTFFSISGTVLYYNYPKINSIKRFYFKRWKSIFPSYYVCYIIFFIKNIIIHGKIFYNGHWSRLIFPLFGLGGYLKYIFNSYHLIGEWFLGAIIIIYSLYSILCWLMNKNILLINFITILFYPIMYLTKIFIIRPSRNIFTCINSFYLGMLGIKFNNVFFKYKVTFVISLFIFIFLSLKRIGNIILIFQIQGFALFIILVQIGDKIMKYRIKSIFIELSSLSYNIFLFHHAIIRDILDIKNPTDLHFSLMLLVIIIILIIILSKILFIIVKIILNSKYFITIENIII